MQIKTRTLIIAVLVAFVLCFGGGYLLGRHDRFGSSDTIINNLNSIITTYAYEVGGLQKQAREKDAIIMTQKQAIKEGLIFKEELRKLKIKHLNEVTHLETNVEILLDSIAYIQGHPPVNPPCPPDDNNPVLYLPLTFQEKSKYLDLTGTFDEQAKLSLSIKLPITMDVYTFFDRKEKQYKATLTYENPYIQTIDIRSVRMEWQKASRWGIGIMVGYGFGYVDKQIRPTPFIGVGLTRTFVRF